MVALSALGLTLTDLSAEQKRELKLRGGVRVESATEAAARAGLREAGFTIGATESPIVPVVVGSAEIAIVFWRALLQAGVYVNLMLPPATRPDACLLRTSYSAAHTADEIDRAVEAFATVGRALGVVAAPTPVP